MFVCFSHASTLTDGTCCLAGVFIIFSWRLFAKWTLHNILPPLFRSLALLFTLPNRKFYTPATDYDGSVPEDKGLHPIPSVIDIPGMMRSSDGGASTALPSYALGHREVALRNGKGSNGNGYVSEKVARMEEPEEEEDDEVKKHYDADGEWSCMVI